MFAAVKQVVTVLGTTSCMNNISRSRSRIGSRSLRRLPTTITTTAATITTIATRTLRKDCIQFESKLWYQQQQQQQQQQQIHQHQQIQHRVLQNNNNNIQKRGMMMARSSMDPSINPSIQSDSKAMTFLIATLGYEQKIAQGVISALKQSGVSSDSALLSMVRTLAGRWEVDEDAGLEALVESVTLELSRSENKELIKFWIVPSSGWPSKEGDIDDNNNEKIDLTRAVLVEGYEDLSLTDVAKFGDSDGAQVLGEMIECACSGIMACSTCHIVVANEWFDKVGKPSEAELDMIDLAYNPKETSRLGCQVILKPELNNAIFKMPRGANNMMDFIPFEDV